jgi:hypothetical protein
MFAMMSFWHPSGVQAYPSLSGGLRFAPTTSYFLWNPSGSATKIGY